MQQTIFYLESYSQVLHCTVVSSECMNSDLVKLTPEGVSHSTATSYESLVSPFLSRFSVFRSLTLLSNFI